MTLAAAQFVAVERAALPLTTAVTFVTRSGVSYRFEVGGDAADDWFAFTLDGVAPTLAVGGVGHVHKTYEPLEFEAKTADVELQVIHSAGDVLVVTGALSELG